MEFSVFKDLFIDLDVRCACKLFLYNLLIVKSSTPDSVIIIRASPCLYILYIYNNIWIMLGVLFFYFFYVFSTFCVTSMMRTMPVLLQLKET